MVMEGFKPALEWGDGETGREVWYGLITDMEGGQAFWYRFTLLSTKNGYREARVWAALTGEQEFFVTERYGLDSVELTSESVAIGDSHLTPEQVEIELQDEDVRGRFSVTSDDVVFTPLRSGLVTRLAVAFLGSNQHWSYNQSTHANGELQYDMDGGGKLRFKEAPAHQGHTAGTGMPGSWVWMHSNCFDSDIAIEALKNRGRTSVCLRVEDETYLFNRLHHVAGPLRNRSSREKPGEWSFSAGETNPRLDVFVRADSWRLARYLAPDESYRYVAHSGNARVDATYRYGGRHEKVSTGNGRVEWGSPEPPVRSREDYLPVYPV